MKHGVRIRPEAKRMTMARRAYVILKQSKTRRDAIRAVEREFEVSTPTARNLIGLGEVLHK